MAKFRKKPIVIEAIQWTGDNLQEVIDFIGVTDWTCEEAQEVVAARGLPIYTLEGRMLALTGDYIIRGVKGELYPCKPDIFKQTYEEVV